MEALKMEADAGALSSLLHNNKHNMNDLPLFIQSSKQYIQTSAHFISILEIRSLIEKRMNNRNTLIVNTVNNVGPIYSHPRATCWHSLTNTYKGNAKIPFPSFVFPLSVECLPVIIKNSGMREKSSPVSERRRRIPASNTSCKQPSVSCVEAHVAVLLPCDCVMLPRPALHPWMQKSNPSTAYTRVTAQSPLIHSKETPSVTFSLKALLQAKTIKANRVQMFEPEELPTSQYLTHCYPYA